MFDAVAELVRNRRSARSRGSQIWSKRSDGSNANLESIHGKLNPSSWLRAGPAWRLGAPIRVRRFVAALAVTLIAGTIIVIVSVNIPAENLQGVVDRTDFASKLLTAIGLLAALTWALFKFVIFPGGLADELGQKTYSVLQLDLECASIPYRDDLRITTVTVSLANVGTVPIRAGKPGCRLSLWEVSKTHGLAERIPPDAGRAVLPERNLLASYDQSSPYVIGSGVTYRESESLVLPAGMVVLAKATFHFGGDDEDAQTERRLFRVK